MKNKCSNELENCISINAHTRAHYLYASAKSESLVESTAAQHLQTPLCLSRFFHSKYRTIRSKKILNISERFNVSLHDYCSIEFPENEFLLSIGDLNTTCPIKSVKFPLNGKIVYTPLQFTSENLQLVVKVYTEENKDDCRNVNVVVDTKDKLRICELTEFDDTLCKFSCLVKDDDAIAVFLQSYEQKLCDIQMQSKTSLINVCL